VRDFGPFGECCHDCDLLEKGRVEENSELVRANGRPHEGSKENLE